MSATPELPPNPETPGLEGAELERYKHVLDDWAARRADAVAQEVERRTFAADDDAAQRAAEAALLAAIQAGYIDVAKGTLDRAIQRGTFLTTVASAIATSYAALLGLIYGIGDHPTPLPARAVPAFVFLGLSLTFAAVSVSFLSTRRTDAQLLPTGLGGRVPDRRLATFITWTMNSIMSRAWALRLSVICLGVSLGMLPLPFIRAGSALTTSMIVGGAAVVVAWALGERLLRPKDLPV